MRTTNWIALSLLAASLVACASSNSGNSYSRDQARKVLTVRTGVVESVRPVNIEGTKTPVGTVAGAIVGNRAGKTAGHGTGASIAGVVGAVAGAVVGSAIEEGVTRKNGIEITIKLDTGGLIAIVQEANEQFQPGETVRLLERGNTTRVSH